MKRKNRGWILLLIILIALPFATYGGIFITNNAIADRIEKRLLFCELPQNTELVDSLSIAEKLTGSGNGMQYMGSILVRSELDKEQLKEYYGSRFEFVQVEKQETAELRFIRSGYSFENFPKENEGLYYSVTCWDDDRKEMPGGFISELLDFDIRGH